MEHASVDNLSTGLILWWHMASSTGREVDRSRYSLSLFLNGIKFRFTRGGLPTQYHNMQNIISCFIVINWWCSFYFYYYRSLTTTMLVPYLILRIIIHFLRRKSTKTTIFEDTSHERGNPKEMKEQEILWKVTLYFIHFPQQKMDVLRHLQLLFGTSQSFRLSSSLFLSSLLWLNSHLSMYTISGIVNSRKNTIISCNE